MPRENRDESELPHDEAAPELEDDSIHADFGPRPLTSADTATTRFPPILQTRRCPACDAQEPVEADYCGCCGFPVSPEADIFAARRKQDGRPPLLDDLPHVRQKYQLTGRLETTSDVECYSGIATDSKGQGQAILAFVGPQSESRRAEATPVDFEETQATTVEISFDPGRLSALDLVKSLLLNNSCPHLPKLVDDLEIGAKRMLVTSAAIGMPLLKAWSSAHYSEATKATWLEQLRMALVSLHEHFLLFPSLQPSLVVIDDAGILRIRDLVGVVPLSAARIERARGTLYTAPELYSDVMRADFRADAYSFGAVIGALLLRRELSVHDFDSPGQPASFAQTLPDAMPPLLRLLGKTFVRDPAQRFPTAEGRNIDASGFQEIGEALARCGRALRAVRYDIAGWSSIGIQRSTNEDSFAIDHVRAGLGEFQREVALVCVADGMGGHASGEIASGLAVSTVSKFLARNGLSANALLRQGKDHPLNDTLKTSDLIKEAIQEANRRVRKAAVADPSRAGMGCTLEVMVLSGSRAIIGHVGDSRVYHRSGHELRQVTSDQTVVNRLVAQGRMTPEEAAIHPRRSELSQAVGAAPNIHPDRLRVALSRGDWLLVCSDGLTAHVHEWEIDQVLEECRTAEPACRRLINIANSRGGSDNCTLVVLRVY